MGFVQRSLRLGELREGLEVASIGSSLVLRKGGQVSRGFCSGSIALTLECDHGVSHAPVVRFHVLEHLPQLVGSALLLEVGIGIRVTVRLVC